MSAFDRVAAMAGKEVRHILRDPQMLGFALVMPVALLLLFGYAVSFDVDDVPLVVVDGDQSPSSRELVDRFTASGTFTAVAERPSAGDVEVLFRRGAAKAALVIPPGFSHDAARAPQSDRRAQLLLDGADNTTAQIALGYADMVALRAAAGDAVPPVELRARTYYNPQLRSAVVIVPGLMVVILVMVAVMLTALTIAREYERGSMEQLFATPVGRLEIILGKLAPYFVLGMTQVLLVLTVGVGLFDVPVAGSLFLLFGVAALFILAMLAQGVVISVVTRSQMVASQVAAVTTMLPSILLSGFVFPIDNMPLPLRVIAHILPAKYLVHALRAVMLRGNGVEHVWPDALATGAFAIVMIAVATRRFRRSLA